MQAIDHLMKTKRSHAFTRLELLAVILTLGLIATMSRSLLGNTQSRAERIVCQNNLRQVGRAFHIWASDHEEKNAWWTSWRDGGLVGAPPAGAFNVPGVGVFPVAARNAAWFQYLWVYQGMPSPSILVCPSDKKREAALSFSSDPNGGLAGPRYNDNSVSYMVGLHALPHFPTSLLSVDRHITLKLGTVSCSSTIQGGGRIEVFPGAAPTSWNSLLHLNVGNLLLNDGRVEEFSNDELNIFLQASGSNTEGGNIHVLKP